MKRNLIKTLLFSIPLLVLGCSGEEGLNKNNGINNGSGNDIHFDGLITPTTPEVNPNINTEDPKYYQTFNDNMIKGQPTCLGENKNTLLYTALGLVSNKEFISPFPETRKIDIIGSDIPAGQQRNSYDFKNEENIKSNNNGKEANPNLTSLQNGLKSLGELRKSFEEALKMYPIIKNINNINYKGNISTTKVTHVVGDKLDNIYMYKRSDQERINTTCKYVSNSAYFFLEDSIASTIPTSVLSDIALSFEKDKKIINKIFADNADIDNNGKIVFIIAPLNVDGLKGFFAGNDKLDEPTSNKGDILYINSKLLENDKIYKDNKIAVLSTLIHEYQHMTLFDHRHIEKGFDPTTYMLDPWINEALSMLAEYYAGYGINHKQYLIELFNHSKEISLIVFDDKVENYGFSLLFFRYMQTRFKDDFIKGLYNTPKVGVDLINTVINPKTKVQFKDIFDEFVISLLVSGRGITDNPRYNVVQFNHSSKATSNDEKYWYRKNGFNLAEVIDEVYKKDKESAVSNPLLNNNNKSLSITMQTFSFQLTRWNNKPLNIKSVQGSESPATFFSQYYTQY